MNEPRLVLSLFPGVGILDRAFEDEGFTIVRGPDLLWGGDVKRFHAPGGVFNGLIGGPPCQCFSSLSHLNLSMKKRVQENLIPEFERIVREAQPAWFVMENVRLAPIPEVAGYQVHAALLNNRWLGYEQNRMHRFSFGTRDGLRLCFTSEALAPARWARRVLASESARGGRRLEVYNKNGQPKRSRDLEIGRRPIERLAELQGLPRDFFQHTPFTVASMGRLLGNAVPYPMGRELARAVKFALDGRARR